MPVPLSMNRLLIHRAVRLCTTFITVLVIGVAGLAGCSREPTISQKTPQDVIKTAKSLVKDGRADQLSKLIYADDEYSRAFMKRVGKLLGHLQELEYEVERAFPRDVQRIKDEAKAKALAAAKSGAKSGGAAALLSQISSGSRKGPQKDTQKAFESLVSDIFADPYGWLDENESRLTVEMVTDDQAALLWDGEAILPPVGLALKQADDGKWFLMLPLNLPIIAKYAPKTREEWSLYASMVKVFDNAIVDLRDDVRAGKVASFGDMARKAGEKLFPPMAITMVAISKYYQGKNK